MIGAVMAWYSFNAQGQLYLYLYLTHSEAFICVSHYVQISISFSSIQCLWPTLCTFQQCCYSHILQPFHIYSFTSLLWVR